MLFEPAAADRPSVIRRIARLAGYGVAGAAATVAGLLLLGGEDASASSGPLDGIVDDVTAPVEEVVDPVTEPVVDVTEPVIAPVVEVTDPVVAPVVEPVVEVAEPVVQPVIEQVAAPVVAPVVEDVVAPVVQPVVDDVVAPVVADVLAPVAAPVVEDVLAPVVRQAVAPVLDEVVAPVQPIVEDVVAPADPGPAPALPDVPIIPIGVESGELSPAPINDAAAVTPTPADDGVVVAPPATAPSGASDGSFARRAETGTAAVVPVVGDPAADAADVAERSEQPVRAPSPRPSGATRSAAPATPSADGGNSSLHAVVPDGAALPTTGSRERIDAEISWYSALVISTIERPG